MRLNLMYFQGAAVGLQLTAENEAEENLLVCLEGRKAELSRNHRSDKEVGLFLCPRLP